LNGTSQGFRLSSNSRGFLANRRNFKCTAHHGRHTKEMTNPLEFLQEVRAEGAKVTWPTRRETLITTGLVIFMVLLASLFFVAVDQALRFIVTGILSIGR
jgi:preprotein translocase subunit SecE